MASVGADAAAARAAALRGDEKVFAGILAKTIPAEVLHEDDRCLAFRDLNPVAPFHALVIPKRRIAMLQDAAPDDAALLGHLLLTAAGVAKEHGLDAGYRVIVNNGADGLQSVGHLHVHVVGGAKLTWGDLTA